MSFLMKHYEKIVLTIFLVIFLGLLVYLLMIFSQASEIKPEDLKIPNRKADYNEKNFEDPQYVLSSEIVKNVFWVDSVARDKDDKAFTDFMKCFPAAKCVNPKCKKVIPLIYFQDPPHTCPLCMAKLPKPVDVSSSGSGRGDKDKDGIPDDIEVRYGLNPIDPNDAMDDLDNDGFTNLDEFKFNPEGINNPQIHPPYAKRLKVDSIVRTKLSVVLRRIKDMGSESDKSKWELHMKIKNPKNQKLDDYFSKIGDILSIDGDKYKIIDAERKFDEKFSKAVNSTVKTDKSEVIIEQLNTGDKVTLVINEQVYAPKEKVVLKDIFTQTLYPIPSDKEITVGAKETGYEKYIVQEVDPVGKKVELKLDGTDKLFTITEKAEAPLPRNSRVSGDAAVNQTP